jgi:hypothetical protein
VRFGPQKALLTSDYTSDICRTMDTVIHDATGGTALGTRLPQDAVGTSYAHRLATLHAQTGGRRGLPLPSPLSPLEASVSPVDRQRSAGLPEKSSDEGETTMKFRVVKVNGKAQKLMKEKEAGNVIPGYYGAPTSATCGKCGENSSTHNDDGSCVEDTKAIIAETDRLLGMKR